VGQQLWRLGDLGVTGCDPYAVEVVADTDRLMTMCNCSQSSDNPY
jgi:hypothetical protein